MEHIILISKDVLRYDYFSCYGSKIFQTPNIDDLAVKGTLFKYHYTAAPSSAMAYTCMFSGLFAHELDRKKYKIVSPFKQTRTLFDVLENDGYSCNVIWHKSWYNTSYLHSRVFGCNTEFHNMDIAHNVGPHRISKSQVDPRQKAATINIILEKIDKLLNKSKLFIWVHLPHVIKGCVGYGSDISVFDDFVGEIKKRFDNSSIYLTSDHGQMNIEKGIPVYGFHVYEGAIRIPLITPRINEIEVVKYPTSNIQLMELIIDKKICKKDFVYSDSQYYMQGNRKIAILKDNYKYIFNKFDQSEELFDIHYDPGENVNLLIDKFYDQNRFKYYNLEEIFHYKYWEKIHNIYLKLKKEKDRIWREGSYFENQLSKFEYMLKQRLKKEISRLRYKKVSKGKFNSKIRVTKYSP